MHPRRGSLRAARTSFEPPGGPMERMASTNIAAVVSLVCGFLTWFALPLLGALIAIVAGHGALRQIRSCDGSEQGEGLALAGLALGWLQIGLLVLALVGWLLMLSFAGLLGGVALVAVVAIGVLVVAGLLAMLGFGPA